MIKIKDKKEFVNIIAITLMFSITIVFFISFIHAYLHGYYLNVSINEYREANPEIILLTTITILGLYSLIYNLNRLKELKWKKP